MLLPRVLGAGGEQGVHALGAPVRGGPLEIARDWVLVLHARREQQQSETVVAARFHRRLHRLRERVDHLLPPNLRRVAARHLEQRLDALQSTRGGRHERAVQVTPRGDQHTRGGLVVAVDGGHEGTGECGRALIVRLAQQKARHLGVTTRSGSVERLRDSLLRLPAPVRVLLRPRRSARRIRRVEGGRWIDGFGGR